MGALSLATGFGVQRLRARATDLAVADYHAQQLTFAKVGAERVRALLATADLVANTLQATPQNGTITWAVAPLLRESGARLVLSGPGGTSAVGGDPAVPVHSHPEPSVGAVHVCPQCVSEHLVSITRAVSGQPHTMLTVQFPAEQTYRRLFAQFAGPFRAYVWVMTRDGTVLLSPDPTASGTRPFDDASDFQPTLAEIRAAPTGATEYRWVEASGVATDRLLAWSEVPGAPDVFVLYSADQAAALARTESFTDDARWLVQVLALGLILLALFIGFDTHLRLRREREARDRLALTEARYRTMVGQAADMLLEVSSGAVITSLNDAARRGLGDVVGRQITDIFEGTDADTLTTASHTLESKRSLADMRARVRCGDDSIPVSVRAACIQVAGMAPFQQWALRDLSAVEREHKRVIQMEKLSTIGRLTAVVSHEIKNPLASIMTNAEYARGILDSMPQPGRMEVEEVLDDILAAVGQIDGIVKAVGGVVRNKPNHRHIDLRDTVKSALVLAGPRLSRGANLALDLEIPLPTVGAAGELSQIVVNVLVNAAQAVGKVEGGTITVRGALEPNHVVLYIEDNGGGIDEVHLNRLFDPFFTTRATGEGTGLGLAVSREIAKRHGGELTCTSEPGRTTFELRLPRGPSLDAEPASSAA